MPKRLTSDIHRSVAPAIRTGFRNLQQSMLWLRQGGVGAVPPCRVFAPTPRPNNREYSYSRQSFDYSALRWNGTRSLFRSPAARGP